MHPAVATLHAHRVGHLWSLNLIHLAGCHIPSHLTHPSQRHSSSLIYMGLVALAAAQDNFERSLPRIATLEAHVGGFVEEASDGTVSYEGG